MSTTASGYVTLSLAYTPDGSCLAAGCESQIYMYSVNANGTLNSTPQIFAASSEIRSLEFANPCSGTILAVAQGDRATTYLAT